MRKMIKKIVKSHVELINELIPDAIRVADEKLRKTGIKNKPGNHSNGAEYTHCMWTEFYHKEMNRLTKKAGLRI